MATPASSRARVMVVDDSLLIRALVKDELEKRGYQVTIASSGEEALAEIRRNRPDLVIGDVVMPGLDGYALCRRLRQDPVTRKLPILLLTGQAGIAEKVRGFEAGADDYLTKPFDPVELVARVGALLARTQRTQQVEERSARAITCFSLKGGVGTTTVAVNLAISLAQLWGEPVGLVDLSLENGCCALVLNLSPQATLEDLCREAAELAALAPADLDLYLTPHSSGVQLLAAPVSPERAERVQARDLPTIIEALRIRFNYLVFDTAATFRDCTLAALDVCHTIVLVATPDLASLKATRDTLATLSALGGFQSKTKLVLNQVFERGSLGRREVENSLRSPVAVQVPFGGPRLLQALNSGDPIVLSAPDSPTAEAIQDLAYLVSDRDASLGRIQSPSALLAKVRKRFGAAE